jgi:hypothetical protein
LAAQALAAAGIGTPSTSAAPPSVIPPMVSASASAVVDCRPALR